MLTHPPMARRAMMPPPQPGVGQHPANPWRRPGPGQAGEVGAVPLRAVLPLLGGTSLALGLFGLLAGTLLLG